MFPAIWPMVAVSSPSSRLPLDAVMLGSARLLVPRIITAEVLLLAVWMVPNRVIRPACVPSCPVSVMVPPLVPDRGRFNAPPVALIVPGDCKMPRPVNAILAPPLAWPPA